MSARKPHNDWAGYVAELRNKWSGGHTVIVDCRLADEQGCGWVESWRDEGGRWLVVCNEHSTTVHCTNLPAARQCMKDPTYFCDDCRHLAGEA